MLIVKKTEEAVTIELPKTAIKDTAELDSMIAKLQEAKAFIIETRQRRLEESLQPIWET